MLNKPIVSIIIPCYNAEKYLTETILSAINQTYSNKEIIVVNDGSSDNSGAMADSFAKQFSFVHVIHKINEGVSIARNTGYHVAKGTYFAFLDADDILTPECIEKRVNYLEHYTDVGIVHNDLELIDEKSKSTGEIKSGIEGMVHRELLLWKSCVIPMPSSILVRKTVLEKCGLFDRELSNNADQELFFRITLLFKVGRIAEPLTKYRIHKQNMSSNVALLEKDTLLAYSKAVNYGMFTDKKLKDESFAKMYLILAGSFWVNKRNFYKTIYYTLKSLFSSRKPLMSKLFGD